jgi:acetyl esterase/lipase
MNRNSDIARAIGRTLAATTLVFSASQLTLAEEAAHYGSIEPDGTVVVPSFELPPSAYLSKEALEALPRTPIDMEAPMRDLLKAGKAGEARAHIAEIMAPRHKVLKDMYEVVTRESTIAGIQAFYATPANGVPAANKDKILLNLPGGGFVMGHAGGTGMTESIPLAGLAQVEIVSITYRQAPETTFPAASEDVARVYRELLKTYKPENIAIFGCSAGGALTAQSMAWFVKEKLPLPAAIGIFCASADSRWEGDSRYFDRPFHALPPRGIDRLYFEGVDLTDPLVSPIMSPDILKQFPPTLLITATRAGEMSSAVNTHKELIKVGVDADLNMWDGLGHAFFYDPSIPESREAFDVMTAFFGKHLHLKH